MAEKKNTVLNEDEILSYLTDIVKKIKTEVDPFELNGYRRLFRKAVPFTLRSYFAAYLLKCINEGTSPGKIGGNSRNDRFGRMSRKDRNEKRSDGRGADSRTESKSGRQSSSQGSRPESDSRSGESRRTRAEARIVESRTPEPRPVLPEEAATTLFISIGRNRRVYPRDLIGLIIQNAGVEREHIGEIRVLDNYSFVQVLTEDADTIIQALNEFEYRGRKLAVSFSRKREDEVPVQSDEEDTTDALSQDSSGWDISEDSDSSGLDDSGDMYDEENTSDIEDDAR